MSDEQKFNMVAAMKRYGGSFVQALAECFQRADPSNQRKLEAAFPEYVEKYLAMAGIHKAEGWLDQ